MKVDVICPLYEAHSDFSDLFEGIQRQKNVEIQRVVFPVTDSKDNTLELARSVSNATAFSVNKEEFSHSLTREKAMAFCHSDVVIFLSQDVKLEATDVFEKLASCIRDDVVYAYARQISKYKGIEKYTRQRNYPENSFIRSKTDIDKYQIKAFFGSDACAAYDRKVFTELGGYDHKRLVTSEDMYYCRKVLLAGYKTAYCAEAVVYHSHHMTLKQVYHRYYDTGLFFRDNPEFQQYKSTGAGADLAFYVLRQALKHFDLKTLFRWLPDMAARYLGQKKGIHSKKY